MLTFAAFIVGLGLIVAGVALLSTPAALIVAGALCAACSIAYERGETPVATVEVA